jgi:hypothetical protein
MDPLHMARVQDTYSSNPRYYAYVHIGVLCIEEYAPNLVVDDDLEELEKATRGGGGGGESARCPSLLARPRSSSYR